MNKVININFQGSIIPIEESASELLRNYIHSLRKYFASEEGRDEIISDIESRIAELFLQRLKKGNVCITDADMKEIMASIGYPEDLEAANSEATKSEETILKEQTNTTENQNSAEEKKRLYRSVNNQVWGGVAAGLADYFGIDVSIMRVIFVFCLFAGFGFIVYLVLWAVLPEKYTDSLNSQKRKLFRDAEHKKLGGVASGLSAYFETEVWVVRLIFLSPIIFGIIGSISSNSWLLGFDVFGDLFDFAYGGFGGALFIVYVVLWAVLPEANTAAEKLQMRGEKVDLESIKKTVNEDLQNFKSRAEKWGKEAEIKLSEKAKMMQSDFVASTQNFTKESNQAARRSSAGIANAAGVLAKVFVLAVLGIIIFSLLMGFTAVSTWMLTGHQIIDFILINETEKSLLWATLILFVGVPIIGLLMWLVRVMRGVQSPNKYVGYLFSFLHVLGWISLIVLVSYVAGHFKSRAKESETTSLITPVNKTLYVTVDPFEDEDLIEDWRSGNPWPKMNKTEDSIYSSNIRVKVIKSRDSLYHVRAIKIVHGNRVSEATELAKAIQYPFYQRDSVLHLSKYFAHHKKDKFHLQQITLVMEVPVGASINLDKKLQDFDWVDIRINTGSGFNIESRDENEDAHEWEYGENFTMKDTDY